MHDRDHPCNRRLPLILTLTLGTVYFGSGKIKKGGISPIMLICLSALAGIAVYGL